MSWGDALEGAAGLFGANRGEKAAEVSAENFEKGLDWTKQVYGDAQGNFQSYLGLGQTGVSGLQALYGGDNSGWMKSPDYLAARDAGLYSMDHSAARRGRLNSGGYAMDAAKGLGDIAAGYLGNYRQGLMGLAGMGQQSAASLGGIGTATAQQVNSAYGNIGNAQASGYGAQAGGISGLAGVLGQGSWASRPIFGSAYGGGR